MFKSHTPIYVLVVAGSLALATLQPVDTVSVSARALAHCVGNIGRLLSGTPSAPAMLPAGPAGDGELSRIAPGYAPH